jgi:hypothetical protein
MQLPGVIEITLRAQYFNADTETRTFSCSSVADVPARYVKDVGADGTVMLSEVEPRFIVVSGIDANAVGELGWEPNRILFRDNATGEMKELIGELRDTLEANTIRFSIPLSR